MTAVVARRSSETLFFAVCAVGIVAGLVLGVREVRDRPSIEFGDERVRRQGLVATVQVTATNRTDEDRCPEIRIAARDREGLDLQEVVARPADGGPKLAAGQSTTYVGVFRRLDAEDYDEKLDEFVAYEFADEPCPGAGTAN